MSSDQQIPLTAVRGLGPTAAAKMAQCGIQTANQLAEMSIAEFKVTCPNLEKRAGAYVKAARRLLKKVEVGGDVSSMDDSSEEVLTKKQVKSPRVSIPVSTPEVADELSEPKKKEKKVKKADKDKKAKPEKEKSKEKKGKSKDKTDKEKKKSKKEKGGHKDKPAKKLKGDGKSKEEKKNKKKKHD